jgi:Arc/MetJ-type ribon-helix-helix transcriptional regulator
MVQGVQRRQREALEALLRRTEPEAASGESLQTGRTVSVGIGLKEGEIAFLDAVARQVGRSRNALLRYAVRRLIEEIRSGALDLKALEGE